MSFFKIIQEYKWSITYGIPSETTFLTAHMEKMEPALKDLYKQLRKHKSFNHAVFVKDHEVYFYRIHDTTVGEYAKLRCNASIIQRLRAMRDTLFSKFGIPNTHSFQHLATEEFNKFIKGITYFRMHMDGSVENPVYHREMSCGAKSLTYEVKFVNALTSASETEKQRIVMAIRACYVERMIYDQIYTTYFHFQDTGHQKEMQNMNHLYNKHYKFAPLSVKVQFDEEDVKPVSVTIFGGDIDHVVVQEYVKIRNSVQCKMNKNGKLYTKQQTFDHEESWLRDE